MKELLKIHKTSYTNTSICSATECGVCVCVWIVIENKNGQWDVQLREIHHEPTNAIYIIIIIF